MTDPLREKVKAGLEAQINAARAVGDIIDPTPLPGMPGRAEPLASVAVAAEPTSEAPKAEPPAKDEPRYAGKYKSVEELEKGYNHLLSMSNSTFEENKRLKEQSSSLPGGSPGSEPRVNPVARTPVDWRQNGTVVKLAENIGLDPSLVGDFAQSIYDVVAIEARQAAEAAVTPIYAQSAADAYMRQNHPDAFSFSQELGTFLKTADPVVQGTFQDLVEKGNYTGASEYAWLAYRQRAGQMTQAQVQADAQITEGTRQRAKANAAVSPTSPGTPVHAADPTTETPSPEVLQKIAAQARAGNVQAQRAYRDLTVGAMLRKDPAFNKMIERHNAEHGLAR